MRAERIVWVGNPSRQPRKSGLYPAHTTWPYRTFDGDNLVFYMGESEHSVYVAEKALLGYFYEIGLSDGNVEQLSNLIEKYGDARYEQGREDESESRES